MKISFERTADYELLDLLLQNPKLYSWMADDFALPIEQVHVPRVPGVKYVLARCDGELLGFFILAPQNWACWELHTVMPLDRRALAAMKELFRWVWLQYPRGSGQRGAGEVNRIVTTVPAFNRIALRFGLRAGLIEFGLNEKSYRKNGRYHDQHLLGITRPEDTSPCHS